VTPRVKELLESVRDNGEPHRDARWGDVQDCISMFGWILPRHPFQPHWQLTPAGRQALEAE
jgi:hypothetical protein